MPKPLPAPTTAVYLLSAAVFEAQLGSSHSWARQLYESVAGDELRGTALASVVALTFAQLLYAAEGDADVFPEYQRGLPRLRRACAAAEAAGYTHLNMVVPYA